MYVCMYILGLGILKRIMRSRVHVVKNRSCFLSVVVIVDSHKCIFGLINDHDILQLQRNTSAFTCHFIKIQHHLRTQTLNYCKLLSRIVHLVFLLVGLYSLNSRVDFIDESLRTDSLPSSHQLHFHQHHSCLLLNQTIQ